MTNYGSIDWTTGSVSGPEGNDAARFYDATQDLFLCQHVESPTRYRHGCVPSVLDLVFTSNEYDIDEVRYFEPLGKSDHVVLSWEMVILL